MNRKSLVRLVGIPKQSQNKFGKRFEKFLIWMIRKEVLTINELEKIISIQPELSSPCFLNTKHEIMFGTLFPELQRQVCFGTGKGGLKKWGSKKYTADFYSPELKAIFEIDGKSHSSFYRRVSDYLRDKFFESKGIKTYRISNKAVEKLYVQRVEEDISANEKQYQQVFNEFFGS